MRRGIFILLLWLCAPAVARAQATRTWVSGVGDDANACSRTAPCKTLAGALAKTAAGGEIDALDPGDFGPVTLTKSITLDGLGAPRLLAAASSTGVTVAAGATDTVILRGLLLHGDGTGSGVLFSSGAALLIEDCAITGFKEGVDFAPQAGGQLLLRGVTSTDNADAGVRVRSAGAPALATLVSGRFDNNATGVQAGAGARVDVYDSVVSGNSGAGVAATLDASGGTAEINLQGVAIDKNGTGVAAAAPAGTAIVRMSQVLGTGNASGPTMASGNGSILSFGDNRLDALASIQLSSPAPTQQATAGAPASFPLAVAVTGVLASPITFACTDLPAGAACKFAPDTLPPGTEHAMVTLTVSTSPSATGMGLWDHGTGALGLPAFALLLLLSLVYAARRVRVPRQLRTAAAGALLLALAHAACNGSPSTGTDMAGTPDLSGLAPGTYAFHATATSGATTASLPLTLVVK